MSQENVTTGAAGRRLTRAGIAAFLDVLAETGMVCEAAAQAGVPRASLYRKRADDAGFAAAWAAALEAGLDRLRDEAVRRAMHGAEETRWYHGKAVGTERRPSDALLMFLLRAHQPAIYREPRATSAADARAAETAAKAAEFRRVQDVEGAYMRGREDGSREAFAEIDAPGLGDLGDEVFEDGDLEDEEDDFEAENEAALDAALVAAGYVADDDAGNRGSRGCPGSGCGFPRDPP